MNRLVRALASPRGRSYALGVAVGTVVPVRRPRLARFLRVGLVAVVGATAVPLVLAPPAVAAPICPSGTYATSSAAVDVGAFICMGFNGVAKGGITKEGLYVKTIPGLSATMPPKLNQPSSVLSASAGGGGGTPPPNNANMAGVNGNPTNGGKLALGTRVIQNGTAIIAAGATGYMIGSQIASTACSWGLDALCTPTKRDGAAANTDVPTDPGDPGWSSKSWTTTDGTKTTSFFADSTTNMKTCASGNQSCTFEVQVTRSGGITSTTYGPGGNVTYLQARYTDKSTGVQKWQSIKSYIWQSNQTSTVITIVYNPSTLISASTGTFSQMLGVSDGFHNNDADGSSYRAYYIPEGSPSRPQPTQQNPDRKIRAYNECARADGTIITVDATSAPFKETDASYPQIPAVPPCPSGTSVVGGGTEETSPGLPTKPITRVDVPQKIKDARTAYPECTAGACRLTLKRIGPADGDLGDCFLVIGRCTGWFTDPNKTANFACVYGLPDGVQHALPLAECNVYKPTFDRGVKPGTSTPPYGDPDTGADPTPDTGNDPSTGDPAGTPSGDPLPAGDFGGQDCFPSGWGAFNPVNWVLQPVKCALYWAFVPDTATVQSIKTDLGTKLGDSGWGSWGDALGGLFGKLGGTGGGCLGPEFDFDWALVHIKGHPLAACDPPLSIAALMTRSLVTILVVVYGGLACLRALGSGFGFNVHMGRAPAEA